MHRLNRHSQPPEFPIEIIISYCHQLKTQVRSTAYIWQHFLRARYAAELSDTHYIYEVAKHLITWNKGMFI
jgi:hypothetical protein